MSAESEYFRLAMNLWSKEFGGYKFKPWERKKLEQQCNEALVKWQEEKWAILRYMLANPNARVNWNIKNEQRRIKN